MLYIQLYNTIVNQIYCQTLCRGDKVPSIQSLCARYGVAYNTARATLRLLCEDGYISRVQRRTSRVIFDTNDPVTQRRILQSLQQHHHAILDAYFARMLVLPAFAPVSVRRFTDADFARVQERRDRLLHGAAAARDSVGFTQALFRLLVTRTGNTSLLRMFDGTSMAISVPFALCDLERPYVSSLNERISAEYIAFTALLLAQNYDAMAAQIHHFQHTVREAIAHLTSQLHSEFPAAPLPEIYAPISYNSEHLYVEVASALLMRVMLGEYRCGTPLPSEAKLCREFGVSKRSLKKAIAFLTEMQVVAPRTDNGTGVIVCTDIGKMRADNATRKFAFSHVRNLYDALELLTTPVRGILRYALTHTDFEQSLRELRQANNLTAESYSPLLLVNLAVRAIRSETLSDIFASIKRDLIWGLYFSNPDQIRRLHEQHFEALCEALELLDDRECFLERGVQLCGLIYTICRESCISFGVPDAADFPEAFQG